MKKFALVITLVLFSLLILPTTAQTNPQIANFSSSVSSISASSIISGTARIPVSWEVRNRPENTNLVFEQVLPDGTVRNAELPRDFVLVDSVGTGTVVPVMPDNQPENLVFRVRLVSLPYDATLVSQSLTVAIDYQNQVNTTSQLSIASFSVDNNYVVPSSDVTFSWEIAGDFQEAEIYYGLPKLGYEHVTITEIDSSTGNFTYSLANVWGQVLPVVFNLKAVDNKGVSVEASVTIYSVDAMCYEWDIDVPETGCADNPIETINAVYQRFEHGFMLWLELDSSTNSPLIWVFYDNGLAHYVPDWWDGNSYPVETAPNGLLSPERGFGNLWYGNPEIQATLGWATSAEQNYTIQYQANVRMDGASRDWHRYYLLPDGRIIQTINPFWDSNFDLPGANWRYL